MRRVGARRRRTSKKALRARQIRWLIVAALVSLLLVALAVWDGLRRDALGTPQNPAVPPQEQNAGAVSRAERPVYPYSVIEGGAASVDELKEVIARDPVVAEHFKHFDLSKTRVETLQETRIAHVSYRKGNDIFWTRKPVAIPAGERVLTDGVHFARTRCGNCFSTAPAIPVSDDEPPAHVLDTPELEYRQVGVLPPGTLSVPPGIGGPPGSTTVSTPPGGSPRATDTGSVPRGGIGVPAPSGPTGSVSLPPGREPPGDEVPPGTPENPSSNDAGDSGDQGSPTGPGPGHSGTQGTGDTDSGNPGGPHATLIPSPGDPNSPFVPPLFPPGNPFNPPGTPFNPPGPPLNPPGPTFDPPGIPFTPPGNPGGPLDPPAYDGPANGPGSPGGPLDPGGPGDPARQTGTIPEPGTTALLLIGMALAGRRLRRRS